MRIFVFCLAAALLTGCFDIDREKLMKNRAEVKPAKPLEVNFERLERQKEDLIKLFSTVYVPFGYESAKNPFISVVDEYKQAKDLEKETVNPLFIPSADEFRLAGILNGEIGNIAVLAVGGDNYYLKTGDSFSESRSTIIFIGGDYIKVRDTSADIFGNKKTEIKEIKIDQLNDDADKERTS
jgi:Tfp pilus assembly protein PilP